MIQRLNDVAKREVLDVNDERRLTDYSRFHSAFGPELAFRLHAAQPTLMDVTR